MLRAEPTRRETESEQLTPIARFKNAAEAGFFAHELLRHDGHEVYVVTEEDFDGLGGYWSTRFVLSAPIGIAEAASLSLQRILKQMDEEGRSYAEPDQVNNGEPSRNVLPYLEDNTDVATLPGIPWLTILLTLTTGGLVFWSVKQVANPPRGGQPKVGKEEDFWKEVSRSDQPWVQQLQNGGTRSLSYKPHKKAFLFKEDFDGDGLFETKVLFEQPPAKQD